MNLPRLLQLDGLIVGLDEIVTLIGRVFNLELLDGLS